MHLGLIALIFAIMFIAELPDKSMFATLIVGTRMPAKYVWFGSSAAFLVHVIIAVTAGKLLTLLPHAVLETVVALLFLLGGLLLVFGKHGLEEPRENKNKASLQSHKFTTVFATAFGVTFLGEWGDITQIATANYAAKYHDPWSVGIGAVLGLWAVTAVALTFGVKALTFIPPKLLQRVTAAVLFLFAILSAISAFK